jgi:integrase
MASIKFFIQSKTNPANIYLRLRDGFGVDAKTKTNLIINSNDWSKTKGMPLSKTASSKQIKLSLTQIHVKILEAFNNKSKDDTINSEWLKNIISPKKEEPSEFSSYLVEYIDFYSSAKINALKKSTFKRIKVNQNLLRRFEASVKHKYLISEINQNFQIKFEKYCLQELYAPNTIGRAIKFIKTVCRHANNNGIDVHKQLDSLKKKAVEVENITLTNDEIQSLYDYQFTEEHLIDARDWLIISCDTGQRISDFMRFKKGNIRKIENSDIIEFKQIKTNELMAVPLTKRINEVLLKRDGNFPSVISDQKYNEYIKTVCKLAGINQIVDGSKKDFTINRKVSGKFEKWELVTSHIGRRSFATNNYNLIPTPYLMYVTGHTTEKSFLVYVGKKDTNRALELSRIYTKLGM